MGYEKKDGELSPEKSKLFSSLEKKVEILRKVFERTNTRVLYREIPRNKKYTKEEAKIAKDKVLNLIRDVKDSLNQLGELSPEEEKYFHS
jgi:hypothetical protein